MASTERRARPRRMVLPSLLLAALAVGWLLNDCVGLGPGGGQQTADQAETRPESQAGSIDAGIDARPEPCALLLDSTGLSLEGAPATIEQATRVCGAAGKARLEATGAARAGTYDELVRALDQAGVDVDVHMQRPAAPARTGDAGSAPR